MRLPILALALSMALAGCFGGDDGGTTPTPTATPTVSPEPTSPATPEPTMEPTPEPTPEPPTPAEPLPPKVVANQTFDFSRDGDATGQSPRTKATDPVPEGYATILLNITTQRTAGLPVSGSVASPSISVYDPQGVLVHREAGENVQRALSFPSIPGTWNVVYQGAGTMTATVVLTAIG